VYRHALQVLNIEKPGKRRVVWLASISLIWTRTNEEKNKGGKLSEDCKPSPEACCECAHDIDGQANV
jgi:hypothetical protein